MLSSGNMASILGLGKRQPRVVSYMVRLPRGKARSALGTAHGARLMLSTPPAMMNSASPTMMARVP